MHLLSNVMPCHFSRSFIVLYSILISSLGQRARGVCSFTKYYKAPVGSKELTAPLPSPTFAQLLEITSFKVSVIPSTMVSLRPPLSLDDYHRSYLRRLALWTLEIPVV
jgi:hypothetical protein